MSTIVQDLRYAIRTLWRSPGFSAIAILTLAIGIGATTAIFSLVQAVLLNPLPFAHADRVVSVSETWRGSAGSVSAGNFADLKAASRSFERLAAARYATFNLAENTTPERVDGARVTDDFFDVFGARPQQGRTFRPEEDRPGAERVVVLSDRMWKARLGGAANVVGRALRLDEELYTVVGIMPPSFDYTRDNEELWVPAAFDAETLANHDKHSLTVFGLLKPGVSAVAANQDAQTIARDLERRFPQVDSERSFRISRSRTCSWRVTGSAFGSSSAPSGWCCSSRAATSRTCSSRAARAGPASCRRARRSALRGHGSRGSS